MSHRTDAYDRTLNALGRVSVALFSFVDNVRMFRVGNFITFFTLVLLIAGVAGTLMTFRSVSEIAGVWRDFDAGLARRIDLLGHFQHYLGQGGVASHWPAALRGEAQARQEVGNALIKVREGFPAFLNADPSEEEKKHLAILERSVAAHERALSGGELSGEEVKAASQALAAMRGILAERRKQGADAVEDAIWSLSLKVGGMMFAAGAVLVIFGLFTFWFVRFRVALPLERINSTMSGLSSGNVRVDVPFTGKSDEVGEMARAVEVFKNNAIAKQSMEAQKQRVTFEVQETANRLADLTSSVRNATHEQAGAAASMSAATEQLSVSIDQVADHAEQALGATEETVVAVKEGERTVRDTIAVMEETASLVGQANAKVNELARQSDRIQEIVGIIQGIAKQTDLLALNASIESARAGEAGRGFAVVADEVRGLAEKTNASAHDIGSILSRIQSQMREVSEEVGSASQRASESATRSRSVGAALAEIDRHASMVAGIMADIANAAREESNAGRDIAQKVEMVASSAETIREQINSIDQLSRDLNRNVGTI